MDTAAAQLETVAAIADAMPPATLRALLAAVEAYGDARADQLAHELAAPAPCYVTA